MLKQSLVFFTQPLLYPHYSLIFYLKFPYLFIQHLVLIFQLLNLLEYFADLHVILHVLLNSLKLIHKKHLGFLLQIEYAIDEFLFGLVLHNYEQDQYDDVCNRLTIYD